MPTELLDLLALLLAPRALVDAWTHPGGLFEDVLDWIDVWGAPNSADDANAKRRWRDWLREKLAFGLGCAFCLSYHAAFWCLLLMYAVVLWLPPIWAAVGRFLLYWLALTQVSVLLLQRTRHE